MSASAAAFRRASPDGPATGRRRPRPRPGLFDLYLIRGTAGPFLVILLAVGAAMMLERGLRLVHELAARGADLAYLLPLLARLAPYYLDLAIPAAFMVALVLLVSRLDDRLELEAMLSAGLSLGRIAAPLVALGVAVAGLSLAAGGWLEPLGRYGYRALMIEARNAGQIARLEPGALYQPAERLALTFDRRGGNGRVSGIFVWQRLADGGELVLTGGEGRIGFFPRQRIFALALERGRYVTYRHGATRPRRIEYQTMTFRESLRFEDPEWERGADQKELTLTELRAAGASSARGIPRRALEAEYYSRLARAAIVPLIPLLVLPLAFATKKGRRGLGIVLGGALLAAFHHGMNLAKNLALAGAADPAAAILGTAGLCAALVLAVFSAGRHLPSHGPIHDALRRAGAGMGRIGRRGRLLPTMPGRTLATYLAWKLALWTAAALLATVVLLQMVDLFERGDDFVERGMGFSDVVLFAWLRLPATVQQALPIAALAGAIGSFAALARQNEMTAIRAAGISQWRILAMALPVPLVLSLLGWALAEHATPASALRFAAWWEAGAPARAAAPDPPARWFRLGDEIVSAAVASPDGRRLEMVDIFRRDGAGLLRERVRADVAEAGPGGWRLTGAAVTRFDGGREEVVEAASLAWPQEVAPADIAAFFSEPPALSAKTARRSLEEAVPVAQGASLFATRIERTYAAPLAPLVMLLLALPLAFVAPHTGRAWPALLYSGAGGLLYLLADGVLTVAAQLGHLPAASGAWAAPAAAALASLTVLLYAER